MKANSKNPYKFKGKIIREYPYQKGGNVYNFLFGDDEEEDKEEPPITAPSTEDLPPEQQDNSEYNMTLEMAMQVHNDPFASRRQYQSTPHGTIAGDDYQIIQESANRYGVPPNLLAGVYGAETNFGKNVQTSSAGAQGPFQFMPATAKEYGVNVNNLSSSADGAAHYLKKLYNQFGNWEQAVAAYNAGPGNIKKGRYPKETQNYVPKVFGYANSLK